MVQAICTIGNRTVVVINGNKVLDIKDFVPDYDEELVSAELDEYFSDKTDQALAKSDSKQRQEVILSRSYRYFHRYGHGQGFGDGERFNPKRRRWNINRRACSRSKVKNRLPVVFAQSGENLHQSDHDTKPAEASVEDFALFGL